MTNRKTPTLAVAFVLISCWLGSATVQAWGPEGHRIIGRIAEAHLTPQAQAGVKDLLNPLNSTSQLSRLSDDQISCWADWIRHNWTNSVPWHFVDIPYNAAQYDPIRDCANHNGCVVEAIHTFSKVLADKHAKREQRLEALKFVVHFVGDIHQPLHCAERNGDKGGNFRMVTFPADRSGEPALRLGQPAPGENPGRSRRCAPIRRSIERSDHETGRGVLEEKHC